MAARESSIYVTGPDGEPYCIGPDDEILDWARDKLDARFFDADSKAKKGQAKGDGADGPPPQSGKGSGKEVWVAYAEANGVEVADDATKDDIIDACAAAGIATE